MSLRIQTFNVKGKKQNNPKIELFLMSLKGCGLLRNPKTFIDMEDFKTVFILTCFTNFVNKKSNLAFRQGYRSEERRVGKENRKLGWTSSSVMRRAHRR